MSPTYNSPSPFRDGFAALRHEPALFAAELTWRWCFGLSAWGVGIVSIALFLDSVTVAPADGFLLRTLQPQLEENALRHIFRGSLSRFVLEQTILLLGVMVLWSLAATAGRAATLRRLVAMFSPDDEPQSMEWQIRSNLPSAAATGHVDDDCDCRRVRLVRLWRSDGAKRASGARGYSVVLRIRCAVSWHCLELVLRHRTTVLHSKWLGRHASSGASCRFCRSTRGAIVSAGNWISCATPGLGRDHVARVPVAAELDRRDRRPLDHAADGACGARILCRS